MSLMFILKTKRVTVTDFCYHINFYRRFFKTFKRERHYSPTAWHCKKKTKKHTPQSQLQSSV